MRVQMLLLMFFNRLMLLQDGGTLRLYPETSEYPMDVEPKADRIVFFWSDRRNPHEVMPVYRNRYGSWPP